MNPWAKFEPASCFPDKCQCEAALDAWVRQPSAFWSSLAYVFAAIGIYRHIKNKSIELKLWAISCMLIGFSSLFSHASFTRIALAFDFASIILLLCFFSLIHLFQLIKLSTFKILIYLMIFYGAFFFVMYTMNKYAKIAFCLIIFLFSLGDMVREMGINFFKAKTLQMALLIIGISFGVFILDETHYKCDPYSLFQWHSIWHLGSALSIYYYGKWRFEVKI